MALRSSAPRSPRRLVPTLVLCVVGASMMLSSLQGSALSWVSSLASNKPGRIGRTARHAEEKKQEKAMPPATKQQYVYEDEEEAAPQQQSVKYRDVSPTMKSRLMEEAYSMGSEDRPITAGFGNPYLLAIVVIGVLGVACYYELGLDKVAGADSKLSDQEVMQKYSKTMDMMVGNRRY
eukprot:TRINITY_DN18363_c0_g1_i1.p2 TRINITY_DN18363_c0_g1~~TRINITY_DN18363_c0_g1_i1.p2  ORF type:complete len:207 (-),score=52.34 TRINITY_DN18363_c0_g1_i1:195-728(-)